jgi:uncharacterized LabA/DUF88 family protein
MKRFAIFCDGSNLIGSLRKLNLKVSDYQVFYKFVFEESVKAWGDCALIEKRDSFAILQRIYWYVLGDIDYIKTSDPKFQALMKEQFDHDKELKRSFLAMAGQNLKTSDQERIYLEAWKSCFQEAEEFYKYKAEQVDAMKGFYYNVRSSTNFIDIIECGHWKVDFLNKGVSEKGLDTQLAVDMVALADQYDIALLISGDADSIPSVNYAKKLGKQVGTIEFIKGHPPEKRGKQFSSRLKAASDFVVQLFEMDLSRRKIAEAVRRDDDLLK